MSAKAHALPMPERSQALLAALAQRLIVLDGAMGTMIQRHRLSEAQFRGTRFADWRSDLRGNNDLLVLTQPDIIADIHRDYLLAGADVIATNTFNSNPVSQADYGMEALVQELNTTAARVARECADAIGAQTGRPRFVAGALGPTSRTASLSPDVKRSRIPQHRFRHPGRWLYDRGQWAVGWWGPMQSWSRRSSIP